MKKTNKAFTLVELIVVIVILTILGTISFIAIQGYTKTARDSVRKTDIGVIIQAMDLHQLKVGKYPEPTNPTEITYSGAEVRKQGVVGKSVIDVVDGLTKIPTDPLTDLPYTYSNLNTKVEFEVAAVLEGEISQNTDLNLLSKTYAGDQIGTAYIKGTYNKVLAKVNIGPVTYVLAVPTIISGDLTLTDLISLQQAGNKMVYHGKNNLPSNYSNSQFKVDGGGFEFNPGNIVAYTGTISSLNDSDNQITLLNNLKTIYAGTDVVDLNSDVEKIDNMMIDASSPSAKNKELASQIIKNSINSNIEIYVNDGADVESLEYTTTAFVSEWKTDNSGISNDTQIKLPLQSDGTYNFTVDWGDGNSDIITTWNQADVTHTYATPGTYEIIVSGVIDGFAFNTGDAWNDDLDDGDKLLDIKQWGNLKLSNGGKQFSDAENFNISATDKPDLSNITILSYMFYDATSFNSDISSWDVSNAIAMNQMFGKTSSFNKNLDSWDVSNVTNMSGMFDNATAFNGSLNGWNVSSVTSMNQMFAGASSFNQDLNNWDVTNVNFMGEMFYLATSFNGSLNGWDVNGVFTMSAMFRRATSFNQNLDSWNLGNVNMQYMFEDATSFNGSLSGWDVSNVTDLQNMFKGASSFNQDLPNWTFNGTPFLTNLFNGASSFNGDITSWDLTNITYTAGMFKNATSFNRDISSWNTSNVTNMQSMFYGASLFDKDISGWNVSSINNHDFFDLNTSLSWTVIPHSTCKRNKILAGQKYLKNKNTY